MLRFKILPDIKHHAAKMTAQNCNRQWEYRLNVNVNQRLEWVTLQRNQGLESNHSNLKKIMLTLGEKEYLLLVAL